MGVEFGILGGQFGKRVEFLRVERETRRAGTGREREQNPAQPQRRRKPVFPHGKSSFRGQCVLS